MRRNDNKGFTLAELLIVLAIIAILVVVAVPVFSVQLEKANEAVDRATARSAQEIAFAEYMLNHIDYEVANDVLSGNVVYYTFAFDEDGNLMIYDHFGGGITPDAVLTCDLPKGENEEEIFFGKSKVCDSQLLVLIADDTVVGNSWLDYLGDQGTWYDRI